MESILIFFQTNNWVFLVVTACIFIWNLVLTFRLGNLKKRFIRFTRGGQVTNLEQTIHSYTEEIEQIKKELATNSQHIKMILEKIAKHKGNVQMVRYNAFNEEGNDLSYSVAFLDDLGDGVVITSIYNRGESNTYAKPIRAGTSTYKLSIEEEKVVEFFKSKAK